MRILVLAPQPFYQVRGTPIAVDLMVRTLAAQGHRVDLLVFHEGEDIDVSGVTLHRIRSLPGLHNVRPGLSPRKLVCDVLFFFKAWSLVRKIRPDVVHAVEEAAFMAWLFRALFGLPYVYDMDSSLPDQVVEKAPWLRPLHGAMRALVRPVVRRAVAVAPVCNALAETIRPWQPARVVLLRDVSLLPPRPAPPPPPPPGDSVRFAYVGNLEAYQGVDLLLGAFQIHHRLRDRDRLTIAGGLPRDVETYRARARTMGLGDVVEFPGHQPIDRLPEILADADVLVSPRIQGSNTPMKIYSYLDAGRPVLATNLFTHTQVLRPDMAVLVPPTPEAMAHGMLQLAEDPGLRHKLGRTGWQTLQAEYSREAFTRALTELVQGIESSPGRTTKQEAADAPRPS